MNIDEVKISQKGYRVETEAMGQRMSFKATYLQAFSSCVYVGNNASQQIGQISRIHKALYLNAFNEY